MKLSKRMLEYRAETNKSQRACANECKISLQTWHSIESGYQNPSKVTRAKIEKLIGGQNGE